MVSMRGKVGLCCFLLTRQIYSQKGLLCRSWHEMLTKMAARLLGSYLLETTGIFANIRFQICFS